MPMAITSEQLVQGSQTGLLNKEIRRRGINVFDVSQIWGVGGYAKSGEYITGTVERPLFGLTIEERLDLTRLCSPVFGVVTARMNRIAGLQWKVQRESKVEDRIESRLKMLRGIFNEYDGPELLHAVIRMRCVREIRRVLKDCRPDLKNFDAARLRWRRRIREHADDKSREVEDWLQMPNAQQTFDDFTKQSVFDLMVHGALAWFQEMNPAERLLENLYVLPGGTTLPLMTRYVGGGVGYFQMIPGVEPKIYFADEITWASYVPVSGNSYGLVPIECLVNKVAEVLMFDERSAKEADGTEIPKKLVVFGEKSPFGDLTGSGMEAALDVPIDQEEASRLEQVVNEPRKGAIRIIGGYGATPVVVDLTREESYQFRVERQRMIREEVALVWNMSNMEINLTGSADTSGRATSESQERIEREKGIYPIVAMLEDRWSRRIIPLRFPADYDLKYETGLSEGEQLKLDSEKVRSQTYSVNEVKIDRGEEPYPDPKFDLPQGGVGGMPAPDGTEGNPLNMRVQRDATMPERRKQVVVPRAIGSRR